MGDTYLLATPILVLGVLMLVRFIGCFIKPSPPGISPPSNLVATPGNQEITLTWEPARYPESQYIVKRGTSSGMYTDALLPVDISQTTKVDRPLTNGVQQFYVVVDVAGDGTQSVPSNEATAVPGLGLVTSKTLGTLRTDPFTGWIGMLIRISSSPLTIVGLGRIFVAGSSGTHLIKVVGAATNVDVPNAVATVALSSATAADGEFVYGVLENPVTLSANTDYYVVSQEVAGGDHWYDLNTTVQTTGVASVTSAVYGDGVSSYTRAGGQGQTYGPVDVLY